jgi:hypothetical protein
MCGSLGAVELSTGFKIELVPGWKSDRGHTIYLFVH